VGEGVLEQLHDRDDARGLVLDLLDRGTGLTDVRQGERHAAAALGQLQSGVDRPADRLHVVFDAQQEAGDELAALLLAGIEEGRRGRLEASGDDLVDELGRQRLGAAGEEERDHDDAVLEAFEVALAVESLERIRGVELEGTDRKSTRLNSSHVSISYAVFCFNKQTSICKCTLY